MNKNLKIAFVFAMFIVLANTAHAGLILSASNYTGLTDMA